MATAKSTTKSAKTTTAAAAPEYKVKALTGAAGKPKTFDPSHESVMAMAATMTEINEPRPSANPYPIPREEFLKLKDKANNVRLSLGSTVVTPDSVKKKTEMTAAMAVSVAEASHEPAMAPMPSGNFEGITATGWIPPDCTMATGPEHVLLAVNSSLAVYNKSGGAALMQRTLTVWFANVISNATIFDPKVLYDQQAGRWVVLAVAVASNPNRSAYLLSVSSTSNPLGPWRNYSLNAMLDGTKQTNNWADYPSLGVDPHALYITSNQFVFNGGFAYAKIRVVPKAGPYSGGAANYFDFVGMKNADNSLAFTVQPCHTFGAPQVEYLVNSAFPNGAYITVWRIVPSGTSFSMTRTQVATAQYSLPPNAAQKGNNDPLNTGDVRVQHAVFRGDSIWCALTTAHSWAQGSSEAAVHWFQIRAAGPTLVQQGIYGARGLHYFYPACCPDNNGNMTMVFSRCSTAEFGSILFTGRKATDPLGQLQGSVLLKAGVANYVAKDNSGRNRWGDYAGVAADPANVRLVWFYSMYVAALNQWGTYVGSAFF